MFPVLEQYIYCNLCHVIDLIQPLSLPRYGNQKSVLLLVQAEGVFSFRAIPYYPVKMHNDVLWDDVNHSKLYLMINAETI